MLVEVLFLTLGFEPGPALRAVASSMLARDARIIVFTPTFRDERAERAFRDLNSIVGMMFGGEHSLVKPRIERVNLNLEPISEAILEAKRVMSKYVDKNVAIHLSGGMRALCIAVFIAYLLTPWRKMPRLYVWLEGYGRSLEIPPVTEILQPIVIGVKREILGRLLREPKTIGQLSIELDKDPSVIYRHVQWLQERKLVQREGKLIKITQLGRLLA